MDIAQNFKTNKFAIEQSWTNVAPNSEIYNFHTQLTQFNAIFYFSCIIFQIWTEDILKKSTQYSKDLKYFHFQIQRALAFIFKKNIYKITVRNC